MTYKIRYICHASGYYTSSCLLIITQRFGDKILPPSSGGKYSDPANKVSLPPVRIILIYHRHKRIHLIYRILGFHEGGYEFSILEHETMQHDIL
jgi:hypothetical protein